MRAACALSAASVSAGCGSDATTSTPATGGPPSVRLSARFTDRTVYRFDGERFTSVLRGAFDWTDRRGFAVERGLGDAERLIQIGDTCYRRFGNERWKTSRATDVADLCDAASFANPATSDDVVRAVARDWHEVGRVTLRGVETTHYRGEIDIGAVRGPVEMWIDDEGVVRRERLRGEEAESYVSVRDYYDFGVAVRVRRPTMRGS
jgi:hypothetical protein